MQPAAGAADGEADVRDAHEAVAEGVEVLVVVVVPATVPVFAGLVGAAGRHEEYAVGRGACGGIDGEGDDAALVQAVVGGGLPFAGGVGEVGGVLGVCVGVGQGIFALFACEDLHDVGGGDARNGEEKVRHVDG